MNRFLNPPNPMTTRSKPRSRGVIHLRLPIGLTVLTALTLLGLVNVTATVMSLLAV